MNVTNHISFFLIKGDPYFFKELVDTIDLLLSLTLKQDFLLFDLCCLFVQCNIRLLALNEFLTQLLTLLFNSLVDTDKLVLASLLVLI